MTVDQEHEYAKSIYQSQVGEDRVGTPPLLFAVWFGWRASIKRVLMFGRPESARRPTGLRDTAPIRARSIQQERRNDPYEGP
jgi:hypothetical protein